MNIEPASPLKGPPRLAGGRRSLFLAMMCSCLALFASLEAAQGALQFDVFLGYDAIVPEASWFPVVCEIKNDGPSFTGTVEVKRADDPDQTLLTPVELPTGVRCGPDWARVMPLISQPPNAVPRKPRLRTRNGSRYV